MSRSTISTFKLFEMFPDQESARLSARLYLEARMWPDGPRCPFCASERINVRKGGYYRCLACEDGENFTVRTNTVMERSKIPLHKWVYAMYLLVTARKGISSMQLAKEIGVTQKSAWFMLHRLREAWKKLHAGRGAVGKTAVLGMRERGGRTRAKVVESTDLGTIQNEIHGAVEAGSQLFMDRIADAVLKYKPTPKSKAGKKRARR